MTKPKILLVDDVRLVLELEKSFLKYSAVRVLTAHDGKEALEVVRKERPDLIFMDLNMPNMNGPTCCSILKRDPAFSSIPVIMVTTAGKAEDEALCRETGCDDYLTKPIDRRVFLEKGRQFLPDIERREPRVTCEVPVAFGAEKGTVAGVSVDISFGGIYVAAEAPMAEESRFFLSFVLPGQGSPTIEAQGRVAWQNPSSERRKKQQLPPGFGVEFTDIEPHALEAIKDYLEGQRKSSF